MTSHPAVRRRPRENRSEVASETELAPLQTIATATVLIISDNPDAFAGISADGATTLFWKRKGGDISGDPTLPSTYASIANLSGVTVIIDVEDRGERVACEKAVRQMLPGATVIVLSDEPSSHSDTTWYIQRRVDPCRLVQRELHQIDTQRRIEALKAFAAQVDVLPILLHPDPDPDAIASAFGIRALLRRRRPDIPIVTLDEITRPENRRMAELLDIRVTQVTLEELRKFEAVICADMQPRTLAGKDAPRFAVIDHHPVEGGYEPEFADIRPRYGATATIITEYLRAFDQRTITKRLATALLYGIKTDTDTLSRGTSSADVAAYAFLLRRADTTLLRRIERPAYSTHTARAYGEAISKLLLRNGIAVAYLGELSVDRSHILPDVADFLLAIEEATWSAAAALVEGRLVLTFRHLGGEPGAGTLARMLAAHGGVGGGHPTMARAVLRLEGAWEGFEHLSHEEATQRILDELTEAVSRLHR